MTDPAGPATVAGGDGVLVVVLAAGEGTRMRSPLPKVLHPLCGRTMLDHVLAAATGLDPAEVRVVVADEEGPVAAALPAGIRAVLQERPIGTGHAVRTALEALPSDAPTVVVLPGDAPLLSADTLQALLAAHQRSGSAATLLTARLADPTGYGRVLRSADGAVQAIVEQADGDAAVLALDEVAVSIYAFAAEPLAATLGKLSTDNAQGQEYLTDVVGLLRDQGLAVGSHRAVDSAEVLGVNDQVQLAAARRALRDRLVRAAMLDGVTVTDPETTWLGVDVSYEPGAVIHQNTQLEGRTHLAAGCEVGPNSTLRDTQVGPGATVLASTATGAQIGAGASIGPYAHLRPGTVLGPDTKVGAFAETKNARVGAQSKIPHLAYVGDATVGERSNIGAGSIVANYDGVAKHHTHVGDDARVGANNTLVAPVSVGDGAYTGADAVIRHDVPAGALAFSQNQQITDEGWAARRRAVPESHEDQPDQGAP